MLSYSMSGNTSGVGRWEFVTTSIFWLAHQRNMGIEGRMVALIGYDIVILPH